MVPIYKEIPKDCSTEENYDDCKYQNLLYDPADDAKNYDDKNYDDAINGEFLLSHCDRDHAPCFLRNFSHRLGGLVNFGLSGVDCFICLLDIVHSFDDWVVFVCFLLLLTEIPHL